MSNKKKERKKKKEGDEEYQNFYICINDVVRTVPARVGSPQEKGSHIWVWVPYLKCWKVYYKLYL